jgi:hypothetical protein
MATLSDQVGYLKEHDNHEHWVLRELHDRRVNHINVGFTEVSGSRPGGEGGTPANHSKNA